MRRNKISHKEMKQLCLKVVADCKTLAKNYIKNWKPIDKKWDVVKGAVYLRLSDNSQVAVERGSLEQQIHIATSEAVYRSEQERINYQITDFYIEPGITGTHDNRPEFIRLQQNISLQNHQFIIFKEISRLVRDVEIWKRFFRLCQKNDCEIFIRGLPFNPNDPASILQLDQLAAYAEFESRTTSKRIKESNHSALITSGKFNGDNPLLGFDMGKNKFGENSGIYKPNHEELKQVKWIMTSFLRADKYQTLVDWCKEKNIKNKKGNDFTITTIKAMLLNTRYIGKWYRNKHNKEKRQHKLMPYDRYVEVSLAHGRVIDQQLWDQVQVKIKRMNGLKSKGMVRCYPLSGLLQYEDGSTFVGSSAWGATKISTYYYNNKNKIRVKTDIFENEAKKILLDIIGNSEKFKEGAAEYLSQKNNTLLVIERNIGLIDRQIDDLLTRKVKMDQRLDFFLENGDKKALQLFKEEYQEQYVERKKQIKKLQNQKKQLEMIKKQFTEIRPFDKNKIFKTANDALKHLSKKDWISLRSVYQTIFKKIIIRPLSEAKYQLKFILKGPPLDFITEEVFLCIYKRVVIALRLERRTLSLKGRCSNQLSYATISL